MSAKTLKIKIKMPSREDDASVSPRPRRHISARTVHRTRAARPKRRVARASIILTTLLIIGLGFYFVTRDEAPVFSEEFAATSETLIAPQDIRGEVSLGASEDNGVQDARAEFTAPFFARELVAESPATTAQSTTQQSALNQEILSITQTLVSEENVGVDDIAQTEHSDMPPPPVANEKTIVATDIENSEPEIMANTALNDSSSGAPHPLVDSDRQAKTDSLTAQHNIVRAQFTNGVVNREPIDVIDGVVNSIENNLIRLFYYTELRNLQGHTITHRWEYEGKMMATVTFKVGGNRWRAYSSKFLTSDLTGNWRVVVNDAQEGTIKVSEFVLR